MARHKKKNLSQGAPIATATPPVKATTEPEATPPEAKAETEATPQVSVAEGLRKLVNSMKTDDPVRKAVEDQLNKLIKEQETTELARARVQFDKELTEALEGILAGDSGLIAKHGVDLSNRKIIITFPNGEETFSLSDVDKNTGRASKSGKSFGTSWLPKDGSAILVNGDGKEVKYDSPSAVAKALGLRITGHRDMKHVFTKPISAETGKELNDLKLEVDAERGSHFIVTQKS